jgi:hypothetical protein
MVRERRKLTNATAARAVWNVPPVVITIELFVVAATTLCDFAGDDNAKDNPSIAQSRFIFRSY